ncbi:hypothetical protein JOF29_005583 [Kribbella aluminosa]|uniref:Porin n=1 Tax=Kribbella aluminosa TaxID=416017 RepID=A0ABS4US71_9ACTN|nr:hypothetical protein [Kribbella aluminosa]
MIKKLLAVVGVALLAVAATPLTASATSESPACQLVQACW